MSRKKKHEEHVNHERWLVSYADFITLLFATFTALYALGNADIEKFKKMAMSMDQAFNGKKEMLTPTISIDPNAKGTGDMVIQIVEAPFVKPGKGEEDGPRRGPEKDVDSIDPIAEAMAQAQVHVQGATQKPMQDSYPLATPTPEPTPVSEGSGEVLIPGAEPEPSPTPAANPDAQLGEAEGKANDALAQQIQQLMQDSGVAGKVEVRKETRGTVISLGEAAFFTPGGIEVMPQSIHTLNRILNALRGKDFEVRIEGHTDDLPVGGGRRYSTNEELSSLRAASIMHFMMNEYGFAGEKLSVAGFGAWRPIASNATPEGRQKNRRVDLVILNQREIAKDPH